ncbi:MULTISPECIES: Fic/DOC family protein [unclassified Rhodococcus (in: high G+C Gram-positive bacteria)]|uniref:Fic/DOC family protein n=1 Tax=unclassified Rhodococcus (in: high G+C Gram-positive bacteria) TaxID=192944 RepID=UPI00096A966D|nr:MULTISPECIES: Fic family protein [unclassified Rhodococcus (in: high G+C Gram-positive bacteria)]MCZ9634620.1 Fic family protein [Rhodococcus sp. BH5]
MKDPYVDPETGVLINKLGHTDPQALLEDERAAAYQRILQLETQPIAGNFDFEHLKKIHQFILQDVYDWAGTLRTRDTGAVGMNLPHCRPEHIENQAAFIFRGIAKDNFPQGLPKDRAVDRLAYHWGETTVLHPFRDGNSRTQRVFFDELLKSSGWTIDWQKVHASAVQAARYVAMEATHTPLRDVLAPGVHRNNTEPPTLAKTQGNVIHLEVAEHHKAMIEHLRSGNREPYNPNELSDIANRARMSFPASPTHRARSAAPEDTTPKRPATPKREHDLGRD